MANTSASGGYLIPAAPRVPIQDADFENFLQAVVVALTGLTGDLVRPAWQPEPPNEPDAGSDWMALRIARQVPDTYAYESHDPIANQNDIQRHETVECMLSAFGPNAMSNLALFRDGILLSQNRDVLSAAFIGVVDCGEAVPAPVLVKDRWRRRYDMTWTIRRQLNRTYPVLTIASGQIQIVTEKLGTINITV